MSTNFASCARGISGNNLDVDTGSDTRANGIGHFATHGVGYGNNAEEGQVVGHGFAIGNGGITVVQHLITEAQCAHGFVLISQQLFIDGLARDATQGFATQSVHNLRCSLDVENALAGECCRAYDRSHVLALGGEGELFHHRCRGAQTLVVAPLVCEPQQQGTFGGVAHHFVRAVGLCRKEGGGVDRNAFCQQSRHLVALGELLCFEAEEACFVNAHLVLCERSRFVCTDNGGGSHGFASMHFAHQVVGLEHSAHAEGQ